MEYTKPRDQYVGSVYSSWSVKYSKIAAGRKRMGSARDI
jgi:hypothetical protein